MQHKMFTYKQSLCLILLLWSPFFLQAQKSVNTIREGNKLYESKEYSEAEKAYRRSLATDAGSFPGNYNLGSALYRQDKHEEAARQYLQGAANTKDKEGQSRAYYNMGNSLLKAEKFEESIEAYKLALRNNPADENAKYNLSYALMKLKKQQQQQQQQNQKDQNKDKNKDQQKQQQQQQQEQQKEKEQQQQQQPKISKEDAERMLEALKNDEKDLQKQKAKRYEIRSTRPEKDW
jgi:Ca-activated chloride channel family protein